MTEIEENVLKLSAFSKAMSHPIRVYILQKLTRMNACCYSGDIVKELDISPSTLSLHFKELKNAGLIQSHSELPYIKYCINKENWELAKSLFKELFD